jgi:L-fucose isomerase-like protein
MEKLGIIGVPSDWLISCNVDKNKAMSVFGIELENIDIKEVTETYERFKGKAVPDGKLKADFDPNELQKAYDLYLALREIVEKHDLKGFTIRCFDLIGLLHTTACLGLSLLNEEGIIASCEGDVPAMITMYICKKIANREGFQANPSLIDVDKNEMIIAHCTLPLNMCTSYTFKTHFESQSAVGIKGEMQLGPVNVVRINSALDTFVILHGNIVENLSRENLCRTQIRIKFTKNSNVRYFLKNPLGNHHIIIYGENEDLLKNYFLEKGLKEVTY